MIRFIASKRRPRATTTAAVLPTTLRNLVVVMTRRSDWKPPPPTLTADANKAVPEKPWPRSVVIGFFAFMGAVVPYTTCWWLSTNGSVREWLGLSDKQHSAPLVDWMRRHFGVLDLQCESEPERVENHTKRYKFVDEPSLKERLREKRIQDSNGSTVVVTVNGTDRKIGANTRASVDGLASVLSESASHVPILELSFPDEEEILDDEDAIDAGIDKDASMLSSSPQDMQSLAIYSAWHYQPTVESSENSNKKVSSRENIAHQLEEINSQIRYYESSMQSGTPVDDVAPEIQKLRAKKRELQLKKWLPYF